MASTSQITLSQLSFVCAVVEAGSFRKAAKQCGVSQPTLSVQIQQLEEAIGALIFDRMTRPIAATPDGEVILQHAKAVLFEVERLENVATERGDLVGGLLRVGAVPSVAPYILPRLARELLDSHPRLELSLYELSISQIHRMLDSHELDMAIVAGSSMPPQFREHRLCDEPLVGYFSPNHPFLAETTVDPGVLHSSHATLSGTLLLSDEVGFQDTSGVHASRGRRLSVEGAGVETVCQLVDAECGYTLVPLLSVDRIAAEPDREARLRPFSAPIPNRRLSLICGRYYNRDRLMSLVHGAILGMIPAPPGAVFPFESFRSRSY